MNNSANNKETNNQQESQQYKDIGDRIMEHNLHAIQSNRLIEKWLMVIITVIAVIMFIIVLLAYTIG